jgi:hypothetical protein
LSVCVKFAIRYDDNVLIVNVVLFGKAGGAGGTNLPSTSLSCAILFVTEVVDVNVVALLESLPAVFAPNCTLFPKIPVTDN